ncbi:MAG: cytochrome P450 [Bacteroidia bacterium]|nr:cytochrome P450 [Bacteroidia bacterium]
MKSPFPTPPLVSGSRFPLGHAKEMMSNDHALFTRGYHEHGKIFSIRLGDRKAAVVCGPELHQWFFKETDNTLSIQKPYRFLRPILGDVVFLAPRDKYLNQRPIIKEMLSREKVKKNLQIIQREAQKWMDSQGQEGEFEITTEMSTLIQRIVGYSFFGDKFMEQIGDEFWGLYEDIGRAMDPVLPPWLPLPKFRRRDQAKKKMLAMLRPIIQERRDNPTKYDDFLQDLIFSPQKDGTLLEDQDIMHMIIALIFAGHETTGGIISWNTILLLENQDFLKEAEADVMENFPYGTEPSPHVLLQLEKVRWAMEETLRMKPSSELLMRLALEDIDLDGYHIPKGWLVMVNAQASHYLPELYQNPEKYDPYRFAPDRREDKIHYAQMTFGGGTHKCPGMSFARMEIQLITSMFLQQWDMTLLSEPAGINRTIGAARPTPTRIGFKRKPVEQIVQKEVLQEAIAAGCPHMARMMAAQKKEAVQD